MPRWKATLFVLLVPLLFGIIVFAAAGRFDLPWVWALVVAVTVFYLAIAATADPSMMSERVKPGPGSQDRITRPVAILLLFAHWIIAGLDVGRFHWSAIPWQLQLAGLIGYIASMVIMFWTMRSNRFYSSVVRIQADRGHHVVTTGPYRFVRHPGYAATMFAIFAGGLALGSWWAMIPIALFVALFLRRALLEDRFLQRELPGYAEYSRRVRYRLVSGLF